MTLPVDLPGTVARDAGQSAPEIDDHPRQNSAYALARSHPLCRACAPKLTDLRKHRRKIASSVKQCTPSKGGVHRYFFLVMSGANYRPTIGVHILCPSGNHVQNIGPRE